MITLPIILLSLEVRCVCTMSAGSPSLSLLDCGSISQHRCCCCFISSVLVCNLSIDWIRRNGSDPSARERERWLVLKEEKVGFICQQLVFSASKQKKSWWEFSLQCKSTCSWLLTQNLQKAAVTWTKPTHILCPSSSCNWQEKKKNNCVKSIIILFTLFHDVKRIEYTLSPHNIPIYWSLNVVLSLCKFCSSSLWFIGFNEPQ